MSGKRGRAVPASSSFGAGIKNGGKPHILYCLNQKRSRRKRRERAREEGEEEEEEQEPGEDVAAFVAKKMGGCRACKAKQKGLVAVANGGARKNAKRVHTCGLFGNAKNKAKIKMAVRVAGGAQTGSSMVELMGVSRGTSALLPDLLCSPVLTFRSRPNSLHFSFRMGLHAC